MGLGLTSCLNSLFGVEEEEEFVPPTIPTSKLEVVVPGTEIPVEPEKPTEVPETEVPPTLIPTVIPTPIPVVVLLSTPVPTAIPVEVPPTPISVLPVPTPTFTPVFTPTPVIIVVTPTPTHTPIPTSTPVPTPIPTLVPQYGVVTNQQIVGIADSLDFSSGPTVSGDKLSFTATYVTRGLGIPTVVQLWQRNGHNDAIVSDANNDDCFSQGPAAFYRMSPARGMQYSKSKEEDFNWIYCINGYKVATTTNVPWVNATSWTYDTTGALETFVFEGSTLGVSAGFNQTPGKWVLVIFAGNTILSEKVLQ